MIATAPMSSTIAIVVSSSFSAGGTRRPSSASTPTAKAMSVAAGIAQPRASPSRSPAISEIDQRRHRHAGRRGDERQPPPRRRRQPAVEELALHLEPDEQEEQRHQPVVDPQVDGHRPERRRQHRAGDGVERMA